jgi:quercetin dioxygenase-like cupin family protein
MKNESSNTRTSFYEKKGHLDPSLFTFDLPTLIETMKNSSAWAEGELNAMVLFKRPEKQIVLTALHEGTKIDSYQANDSVTFQIIEGKLKFHTTKESVTLKRGQLLALHDNIKYSLTSRKETVFLLTIDSGGYQQADKEIHQWR